MKDVIFVVAIIALTGFGLVLWRIPFLEKLDRWAQYAIAFAGGCVIAAVMMFVFSLVHIAWTRGTLLIPLVLFAVLRRGRGFASPEKSGSSAAALQTVFWLTVIGVLTARETCGDLLYFWGPKGQAFYTAEGIDTKFLSFQHYSLMHPDYPPLLPLVYAWGAAMAHRFSWWGALFLTPIALLATLLAFRGITRNTRYTALLAALLGFGFAKGMVAGAGEPLLLLFETIALALLTFHGDDDGALLLAAIALAGAAWVKVEGAAFVAVVVFAYAVTRRRIVRPLLVAAPAAVLFLAWLLFAKHYHLIDQYGRAGQTAHFELLGGVLRDTAKTASYGTFYLPWLSVLAPLPFLRNFRRAALPLLTAGGLFAAVLFFYLHQPDPGFWIASSAERVLLSPLMALLVATAAASE